MDVTPVFSSAETPAASATGTCDNCGGTIPLVDGRIPAHNQHIIRGGAEVEGDQQCKPEPTN